MFVNNKHFIVLHKVHIGYKVARHHSEYSEWNRTITIECKI